MSYHETRLQPGDPSEGPLGQVIAYVDDEGTTHYPGQESYVEPEEGSAEFLADQAQQLAEDQHRIATGQDQQFSAEQRANTVSEADRLTDPSAVYESQPMQTIQDPNAPKPT